MSKHFRLWKIDQVQLLPPSVQDFVPKDHLSRFIVVLVRESLDLGEIEGAYASALGQPPFDPRMMTALLLNGYASGIYSSRRIAKACAERADFMMIAALAVDGRLRVVALDIAVLGEQHAAVGIREVALRLGLGLVARRRGRPAVLLSAPRLALVLDLGPMPRLFGGGSFGVRFQRRLGGADRLDPLLLVGDPVGHLIAACVAVQLVIVGIRGLGRAQPVVDFSLQLGLACLHALIAQRLVLGGVRLDLGAVG